ncbi:hypothetical protein YC2023_004523 [Brassica napus]
MTGTQLLDELAQAVRSLVQLYQLNYVRLDPRKGIDRPHSSDVDRQLTSSGDRQSQQIVKQHCSPRDYSLSTAHRDTIHRDTIYLPSIDTIQIPSINIIHVPSIDTVHPNTVHPNTIHRDTIHRDTIYLPSIDTVHPVSVDTIHIPSINTVNILSFDTVHPNTVHPNTVHPDTVHRNTVNRNTVHCWGQNRSRRNQCLKVRKNQHEHFYEK